MAAAPHMCPSTPDVLFYLNCCSIISIGIMANAQLEIKCHRAETSRPFMRNDINSMRVPRRDFTLPFDGISNPSIFSLLEKSRIPQARSSPCRPGRPPPTHYGDRFRGMIVEKSHSSIVVTLFASAFTLRRNDSRSNQVDFVGH